MALTWVRPSPNKVKQCKATQVLDCRHTCGVISCVNIYIQITTDTYYSYYYILRIVPFRCESGKTQRNIQHQGAVKAGSSCTSATMTSVATTFWTWTIKVLTKCSWSTPPFSGSGVVLPVVLVMVQRLRIHLWLGRLFAGVATRAGEAS